jgi:hypothetical protein
VADISIVTGVILFLLSSYRLEQEMRDRQGMEEKKAN